MGSIPGRCSAVLGARELNTFTDADWSTGALNGSTKRIAWKIFPKSALAISKVILYASVTGSTSGMNWKMGVFADSSDAPGSQLGGYTSDFTHTASGWSALLSLTTDTGPLTVGTPVWIVLEWSSGTAPSAGNDLRARYWATSQDREANKLRHFNGTDWTTVAAISASSLTGYELSDGSQELWGANFTGGTSGVTDIFSTNKQGIRFKIGSQIVVDAVSVRVDKVGTPGTLTARLYRGSTEIASTPAYDQSYILDGAHTLLVFSTPVVAGPGELLYITFENSGASDSNDYDIQGFSAPSGALRGLVPPNWDFISGSGSDPTSYTVSSTWVPFTSLFCSDLSEDLIDTPSKPLLSPSVVIT